MRETRRGKAGPTRMVFVLRARMEEKRMASKDLEDKLLKYMRRRHKLLEQYGPKDLKSSKMLVTNGREIQQEIPEMLVDLEGRGRGFLSRK